MNLFKHFEKTATDEFLFRRTGETLLEEKEAQEEAKFLSSIAAWENLSYEEAYQKMSRIFTGLLITGRNLREIFSQTDTLDTLTRPIIQVLRSSPKRPLNILVTGLGVSGKTTLMAALSTKLAEAFSKDGEVVLGINRDYYDQRILPPADILVVENVNALSDIPDALGGYIETSAQRAKSRATQKGDGQTEREVAYKTVFEEKTTIVKKLLSEELQSFDLIIYTNPTKENHRKYWSMRVNAWKDQELIQEEGPRSEQARQKALSEREKNLARDHEELQRLIDSGKKVVYIDPEPVLQEFFRVIKSKNI